MIRSETRGVARGTAPKRSRSDRGPPVCIISIAQQARPKSMYQTDDFRVQLRSASTLVVITVSGTALINDISNPLRIGRSSRCHPLQPLEIPLRPDVDQTDEQDRDEEEELGEDDEPPPAHHEIAEGNRDREDERDLDVEDHEDQRDEVEPDVEVDPAPSRGKLAAL